MQRHKANSVSQSFILLVGTTTITKLLAFVYQAVIAAKMGANIVTDSYFSATEFYTFITATIFETLVIVLISRYAAIQAAQDEKSALRMLSNVMSIVVPIMLVLGVCLLLGSNIIAVILAPGFTLEQRVVLARCIRLLAITPVIYAVFTIYQAILRQHKQFVMISLESFFISSVGIVCVLLFSGSSDNADAITIGYDISMMLYCLVLFLGARRYGTVKFQRPKISDDIKIISRGLVPLMISTGITKIALMIDKVLASTQGTGVISCLTYAQMLYYFVITIFIKNMCTVLLTDFVTLCTQKKLEQMGEKIRKAVSMLTFLLIPTTILTVVFAGEIVSIVFARGNFRGQNVQTTAELLGIYAISFIPAMIQNIYTHVHYAFDDTVAAMRNGIIAIGINIGVSMGLALIIGVNGVAAGTVISAIISAVFFKQSLRRHLPDYRLFQERKAVARLGLGTVVCLAVSLAVKLNFIADDIVVFGAAAILSFAAFFLILLLLKEPLIKGLLMQVSGQKRNC